MPYLNFVMLDRAAATPKKQGKEKGPTLVDCHAWRGAIKKTRPEEVVEAHTERL